MYVCFVFKHKKIQAKKQTHMAPTWKPTQWKTASQVVCLQPYRERILRDTLGANLYARVWWWFVFRSLSHCCDGLQTNMRLDVCHISNDVIKSCISKLSTEIPLSSPLMHCKWSQYRRVIPIILYLSGWMGAGQRQQSSVLFFKSSLIKRWTWDLQHVQWCQYSSECIQFS